LTSDRRDHIRALLDETRLFVLDLDGTFYLGNRILPRSLEFIDRVRRTGRDFLFFTNNSSRTPASYIEKISGMGCPIGRERILTSGDVMIRQLLTRFPGQRVYLMGTRALGAQFAEAGVALASFDGEPPGASAGGAVVASVGVAGEQFGNNALQNPVDIVVAAFDTELTYSKLERACTFIRRGAVFLATHPDINCPTEDGFIPDCGAFCAAITLSTGREPVFFGKPYPQTLELILAHTGRSKDELAFVGDRLYTDVATGVRNGAKGFLVLSGEAQVSDIEASDVKPDAVFSDLGEIASYL